MVDSVGVVVGGCGEVGEGIGVYAGCERGLGSLEGGERDPGWVVAGGWEVGGEV